MAEAFTLLAMPAIPVRQATHPQTVRVDYVICIMQEFWLESTRTGIPQCLSLQVRAPPIQMNVMTRWSTTLQTPSCILCFKTTNITPSILLLSDNFLTQ